MEKARIKRKESSNHSGEHDRFDADIETWCRGDDPATGKQMGYIAVMAQKAGEGKPAQGMGKTEASQKIEELKQKTGM